MKKADSNTDPLKPELLQAWFPHLLGAGYGMFSAKAADPHWPEILIIWFVLKKYRERSSIWFLIVNVLLVSKKDRVVPGELKALLTKLAGGTSKELFQLSCIYRALRVEKGSAVGTAAIVEIVKITNLKRSGKKTFFTTETLFKKQARKAASAASSNITNLKNKLKKMRKKEQT